MENTLKNAYAEVNQVLEILGKKYKNKIPRKLLKLFKEQENEEYRRILEKTKKVENLQLSRDTLTIISILNLKYWETDEEKIKQLKQQYMKNEQKYQETLRIGRENGWLQINTESPKKELTHNTNVLLLKKRKSSILDKIKEFIKICFKRGVRNNESGKK